MGVPHCPAALMSSNKVVWIFYNLVQNFRIFSKSKVQPARKPALLDVETVASYITTFDYNYNALLLKELPMRVMSQSMHCFENAITLSMQNIHEKWAWPCLVLELGHKIVMPNPFAINNFFSVEIIIQKCASCAVGSVWRPLVQSCVPTYCWRRRWCKHDRLLLWAHNRTLLRVYVCTQLVYKA